MEGVAEDFGAADEVPGVPVGESHLAAGRRDVEDAHAPGFDEVDAVVLRALAKDRRATVKDLACSASQHRRDFGVAEPAKHRRCSATLRRIVGMKDRADAVRTRPPGTHKRRPRTLGCRHGLPVPLPPASAVPQGASLTFGSSRRFGLSVSNRREGVYRRPGRRFADDAIEVGQLHGSTRDG